MKWAILVFPGSNCDRDSLYALREVLRYDVEYVWHEEGTRTRLEAYEALLLPGGFAYGDYLRAGVLASVSPVMKAVRAFAEEGGLVVGICNGFQILIEAGLFGCDGKAFRGTLLKNSSGRFVCRPIYVTTNTEKHVFSLPIAHSVGRFFCELDQLQELQENNQILLRYCDEQGTCTHAANPNGSVYNIAGITNKNKNIVGMMPHPERMVEQILGGTDGIKVFQALVERHTGRSSYTPITSKSR